ncbi:MAG: oligosaccharide flippase family protein [Acidobacteria bacterium]|nr:oligosaccharide flippase family protein [Acidobacteriota bacterium]
MSLRNLFFKDTVIYGFTSYLALAAAFFLTPIYTRILSKADYGTMDLFNTWNNFFVLILPIGLTSAILRLYVDFKDERELSKRYLGTLFLTIIGTCSIYTALMIIFHAFVKKVYFQDGFDYSLYYISLIIIPLQIFTSYFQSLNRIEFKKYTYVAINLTNFLLLTTLGFVFVYFYSFGVYGFFLAALISSAASFVIAIVTGYNKIHFSFDPGIFKTAVKYSFYLLLVLVFLRFTYIVDRTLINTFLTIKDVGEYSIAIRLGNIMDVFIGGFTTAWFPYAMALLDDKNRVEIYQKAFKYYLLIFTSLAFLINLFVVEILMVIAPSYLSIEPIAYIIISNSVIAGTAYFFGLGIHIAKKSQYFLVSAIAAFLVNIGFSFLLVNYLGVAGIVLGSLLSLLTWVLVEYYISYRLERITFNLTYLLLLVLFLGFASIGTFYLNRADISLMLRVFIKLLVSGTAMLILVKLEWENVSMLLSKARGVLAGDK